MTKKQPILDELHAIREQLLADSGGTLVGLVARLQAEQARSDRTILKARRTTKCTGDREEPLDDGRSMARSR
jgi:hypothetical protein